MISKFKFAFIKMIDSALSTCSILKKVNLEKIYPAHTVLVCMHQRQNYTSSSPKLFNAGIIKKFKFESQKFLQLINVVLLDKAAKILANSTFFACRIKAI